MDTEKKELVGRYGNGGPEWEKSGQPTEVKVHDFFDPELGRANPCGVYDLGADAGWVGVVTDHDTAAFAAQTIRRGWASMGSARYPGASELVNNADGDGSNGHRVRLWKLELGWLAEETGLTIRVYHLPPGTSKWNGIEHRLFSLITMNLWGRPLVSRGVIMSLLAGTRTRSGLTRRGRLAQGRGRHRCRARRRQARPRRLPRRLELLPPTRPIAFTLFLNGPLAASAVPERPLGRVRRSACPRSRHRLPGVPQVNLIVADTGPHRRSAAA